MINVTVKDGNVRWKAKGDPITITQEIKALAKQLKKCGYEMDITSELVFSPDIPADTEAKRSKGRS